MTAIRSALGALVLVGVLAGPAVAHDPGHGYGMGYGPGQGMMMGPGMMGPGGMGMMMPYGQMGPGMMGPGMMGPGMMGQGGMGMMMPYGQMGPGMMGPGMMGPGMMPYQPGAPGAAPQAAPRGPLSSDDVRAMLENQLAWSGNPRLKVGEVEEADADTIVADIVTSEGALVDRFEVDRRTGWMRRVQ